MDLIALARAWATAPDERALLADAWVEFLPPEHAGDHRWHLDVDTRDEDAEPMTLSGWSRLIWCPTSDPVEAYRMAMEQAPNRRRPDDVLP